MLVEIDIVKIFLIVHTAVVSDNLFLKNNPFVTMFATILGSVLIVFSKSLSMEVVLYISIIPLLITTFRIIKTLIKWLIFRRKLKRGKL